jgi:hypothetical protein
MIKNLLVSLVGIIFLSTCLQAQITNTYSFTYSSGTFTPVSGGTAPSLLYNGSANSDDGFATIPIGFTFNFNGTGYTNVIACANGFLTFAASLPNNTDTWSNDLNGSQPFAGAPYLRVPRPVLAPLWDDMYTDPGTLTYKLSGSAPNRTLTVEWLNIYWMYNAATPNISFQAVLHETSNIIDFVYRQESGPYVSGSGGASIGISSGTGAGNFISVNPTGSVLGATASSTAEIANIAAKPVTGTIYSFVPYCSTSTNNHAGTELISRVQLGTINNTTTSTVQYENFTNISTFLQPSTSNPMTITLSGSYSGDKVLVWIDLNHNGSFDDAGEQVYTSPNGAGPFTTNIAIPAISPSVLLGPTRMRVKLDDTGGSPSNLTSCGLSDWGQVEDYTVDIEFCILGSISTQPSPVSICNGSNGSISVSTTGTGMNYQWQLSTNGGTSWSNVPAAAPYSGTTTSTLTITGATGTMTGYQYRVLVTGTCTPLIISSVATLTVTTAASFTTNPTNITACATTTANFTAAASGTAPTYQWQVSTNGGSSFSDISGATSSTLSLSNLLTTQSSNQYRAVATVAGCGSVTSSAGILTVRALPTVSLAAAPVTAIKPGVSTTLTITSNPAGASYVWTLNGTTITGANASTLKVDVNGIGTYRATVTDVNGCQNTTSALVITAEPTEKLFIYPNPSTGRFQLRLYAQNLYDVRSVTIYNSAGVKVAEKDFNVDTRYDNMQFDLRHVAPGVYTIHIEHRYVRRRVVGQVVIVK